MTFNVEALLTNPKFWTALITGATTAVEEGSPDYTAGHHIAAAVAGILGLPVISTPSAAAAKPAAQAIADGARAAAGGVAQAVQGAAGK